MTVRDCTEAPAHHWIIDAEIDSDGNSRGTCIFCNQQRSFYTRYRVEEEAGYPPMLFGAGRHGFE